MLNMSFALLNTKKATSDLVYKLILTRIVDAADLNKAANQAKVRIVFSSVG